MTRPSKSNVGHKLTVAEQRQVVTAIQTGRSNRRAKAHFNIGDLDRGKAIAGLEEIASYVFRAPAKTPSKSEIAKSKKALKALKVSRRAMALAKSTFDALRENEIARRYLWLNFEKQEERRSGTLHPDDRSELASNFDARLERTSKLIGSFEAALSETIKAGVLNDPTDNPKSKRTGKIIWLLRQYYVKHTGREPTFNGRKGQETPFERLALIVAAKGGHKISGHAIAKMAITLQKEWDDEGGMTMWSRNIVPASERFKDALASLANQGD